MNSPRLKLEPGELSRQGLLCFYVNLSLIISCFKGKINLKMLKCKLKVETLETVEVTEYAVPLISADNTTSGYTVTAEIINWTSPSLRISHALLI